MVIVAVLNVLVRDDPPQFDPPLVDNDDVGIPRRAVSFFRKGVFLTQRTHPDAFFGTCRTPCAACDKNHIEHAHEPFMEEKNAAIQVIA